MTSATLITARRCARFVTSCARACARSRLAGTATTDDRGIYRIPSLLPGEYVVVVTPRESGLMAPEEMKARELMLVAAVSKMAAAGDASPQARDAAIRDAMAGTTPAPDAPIYAPVYYPGTTQARSATSIPLDVSEERSGVDLRLQLVPTMTVSGQVTADGAIPPGRASADDRSRVVGAWNERAIGARAG